MAGAPSPRSTVCFSVKFANGTADAQYRVGLSRIVPDRHQKREIDADLVGSGHAGVGHLQRNIRRCGSWRQPSSDGDQPNRKDSRSAEQRNPAAAIKTRAITSRCRYGDHRLRSGASVILRVPCRPSVTGDVCPNEMLRPTHQRIPPKIIFVS
ncbi:hypothetical protein [Bradyrhizobium sp. USDA 10063]